MQMQQGTTPAKTGTKAKMKRLAGLWTLLIHRVAERLKFLLAFTTCLLVVASAGTAYFIAQRQSALNRISRYNITWVISQAPVEILRLQAAIAEAAIINNDETRDQVQLRLDIVKNRISLLDTGETGDFIDKHAESIATLMQLRFMVNQVQPLLNDLGNMATLRRLLALVSPLGPLLQKLAAAANIHGGDLVTRDQSQLSHLHTIFTGITTALTTCGFALLGIVTWRNRLLRQAHAEVNMLVQRLQDRDHDLQTQNTRFDAALNNMSQALCMVDENQRVIVCNVRFLKLFGLSADMVQPGVLVEDVFRNISAANPYGSGLLEAVCKKQRQLITAGRTGNFYQENADGHAVAVSHQPMSGNGWVATYEDVSERRQAEARIHFLAHHDVLTSLSNRAFFEERLEQVLKGMRKDDGGAAVLCLDLDHFKEVNDTLGHPAGDKLLKEVAQRLLKCVRKGDIVARLGGDEFAILQSSARQPEHAEALAKRLIKAVGAPYNIDGARIAIGTSIGIAITGDINDASQMLKNADTALYQAKADQRATYCFFVPQMDAQLQARRALEAELREAVSRGELMVFYQPLFDLVANEVTGFEALLRWEHPVHGMISPNLFIPIAEEVGLISSIGNWVLEQACHEAAMWPQHIKVAVNLSPIQLQNEGLVQAVCASLDASGLPARRLELEITESALLKDSEKVLATLHALRDIGVEIALDDFGTGYSSLSYLRSFPFDRVKIDQSFVREMSRRADCCAIVQSIAQLAQKLGIATTAEGVETSEQLDQIREAGCTHAQGYYFSRPKSADQIDRWFTPSAETRGRLVHSVSVLHGPGGRTQ